MSKNQACERYRQLKEVHHKKISAIRDREEKISLLRSSNSACLIVERKKFAVCHAVLLLLSGRGEKRERRTKWGTVKFPELWTVIKILTDMADKHFQT